MKTVRLALACFLCLAVGRFAFAADELAGTWKIVLPIPTNKGTLNLTLLSMLSKGSDGKWVGDVLDMSEKLQVEPTIEDIRITDDQIHFDIKFGGQAIGFDGKRSADGKKINGIMVLGGQRLFLDVFPSKLKKLDDPFAVAREALDQQTGGPYFENLFPVLKQASAKKMTVEEVRALTDRAAKEAEIYGTRWQRNLAISVAQLLVEQEPLQAVALEQARQAERMLTPTDTTESQLTVLDTLSAVLTKAKKADEAKKIDVARLKIEAKDYQEYVKKSPVKMEAYAGRKAKSDRVVLVELFTGSECPPCVAADLAFESVDKTFKLTEVAMLQYHQHIPGPDPMTNKDADGRREFYKVEGTPSIFVGGKTGGAYGGGISAARAKYRTLKEAVEEQLEKPAAAKLTLLADQKGSDITLTAKVAELKLPGEKVFLRFAITEERVRYAGGNGLRYHHAVVRAMPGGPKGFALPKETAEQTVKLNVDELRAALSKSLDEFAKEVMEEFPDKPLQLKTLRAVAFIQDDSTKEVLQAVQVEIDAK
jgi:hypothetical protein